LLYRYKSAIRRAVLVKASSLIISLVSLRVYTVYALIPLIYIVWCCTPVLLLLPRLLMRQIRGAFRQLDVLFQHLACVLLVPGAAGLHVQRGGHSLQVLAGGGEHWGPSLGSAAMDQHHRSERVVGGSWAAPKRHFHLALPTNVLRQLPAARRGVLFWLGVSVQDHHGK